eukprot:TRINITY_DN13450_c0_g1_i1.p1 TRINITY_DN13450_c0_g1~~TRINITY_DN13450_c0_g1_i1.p1  ORF type:complete len:332 (-),score=49.56 TRINITY_DN13450_c0_g1_i1:189-1163(-)
MEVPGEDALVYLHRMKASANQRKKDAEKDESAKDDPMQQRTLLLREVDTMNEEDITKIFHPQFKDSIVSIRLYPPIPGTRGFAFIEFNDPPTAIRAMTLRHRTMYNYRGVPKKLFLTRVTQFKQEDEMKWRKHEDRGPRGGQNDSTPRRIHFTKTGQPYRPGDQSAPAPFNTPVQTVPFSEIQARQANAPEGDARGPPDNRGPSRDDDGPRSGDRRQERSPPPRRRDSPDRRRSPPRRDSRDRSDRSRTRDRGDDRRDSRDRRDHRESRDRSFDFRDREPREDRHSRDRASSSVDRRRESRDDDYDRKRRREDDDDTYRSAPRR